MKESTFNKLSHHALSVQMANSQLSFNPFTIGASCMMTVSFNSNGNEEEVSIVKNYYLS
jgi:hypothetical protein